MGNESENPHSFDIMPPIKLDKGQPVERWERNAVGLTSRDGAPGKASRHKCDQDSQAAENNAIQFWAD
jgi:hypothetical protein